MRDELPGIRDTCVFVLVAGYVFGSGPSFPNGIEGAFWFRI
jgi:hypothetical protein